VRIMRSRNVSPVSWQSRQSSIGVVVLGSARLSRQRSGCYGAAAGVWGGMARVLKGLQGAARGCWSNDVSKRMTNKPNTEITFTHLSVANTGGDEAGGGQQ
jgi:hypothetical protein